MTLLAVQTFFDIVPLPGVGKNMDDNVQHNPHASVFKTSYKQVKVNRVYNGYAKSHFI